MQVKKISENVYEIAKEGTMKVRGVIFASDSLFEKIKQDKTIEQVKNVAMLPGIIEKSIAMPDAHQGYGFSVGGVAAFDLETGIISPGGIGYDINCLTKDAKVLTSFGGWKKIEDFDVKTADEIEENGMKLMICKIGNRLKSLNFADKKIEEKRINFFMSKESEEVYEVILDSGLKIKTTGEHPFLTQEGMKELVNLRNGEKVAVNLFEGIELESEVDEKSAITARLLGYIFGDGCLYKSKGKLFGAVYGREEDLSEIQEDLRKIKVPSSVYSRTRNHKIETRYGLKEFSSTNHEIHINSQEYLKMLVELGMPLGNKTRQETKIPRWIKAANKLIKRLFLAGFFGAEMSSPKTSSKTCFFCPTIDQNKIEKLSQNARDFFVEIALMLEEFDIKNIKISEMDDYKNKYGEKTKRFRLFIKGEEDILKLWRNIGFEYNKKRTTLSNIASLYILLKKQENEKT